MGLEPFTPGAGDDSGEPMLTLTDQQIQQAGVRTEKVLPRRLVREVSTSGMLMKNRERYWHVDTRFQGWIEELFVNAEGETIRKGDPIATIYSPQLYATQKEYLLAMDDAQLGQAARKRLELLGISGEEIKALEDRGEPTARMTIRSPYTGAVVHRNVKPGMKIPADGHICDIADLRELWLYADIYTRDLGLIQMGQTARIRADSFPNETFEGTVDLIDPMVRHETQTARVRIRVKNDPVKLLAGQYVRILLLHETGNTLSVSEQSVIPTGRRDIVIVSRGGGRFVAREVAIGRRFLTKSEPEDDSRSLPFFTGHDRYHEVLAGLGDGDVVVTSGAFLLHAETQIRQLFDKMVPPGSEGPTARSAWSGAVIESIHKAGDLLFEDQAEAARYKENPELSWQTRFPQIEKAVAAVLEQYFRVHSAVADEDLERSAREAKALIPLAEPITAPISEAVARAESEQIWQIKNDLKKAAGSLQGADDGKLQRQHFGELTLAFERWIEAYGPPIDAIQQFF